MLGFLSAIIFLLPLYLIRFTVLGIPTTGLELLIYAATLWLIVSQPVLVSAQRFLPIIRRYSWPIGLILAGSIVNVVIAPDLRAALGLFKAYILDPLLVFSIIAVSQNLPEQLYKADVYKAAFIALGVSLALSGLFIPSAYTVDGRALGVFVLDATASPNFLALLLAPLAAFSLSLACFEKNKAVRVWGGLGFLVMLAGLWATDSRGGLLAVAVTAIFIVASYLYQTMKKQYRVAFRLMGFVVATGLIAAVGWLVRPNFTASASDRTTTSSNIRYEIWRTTIVDMVPRYGLLGVGLGNYQQTFEELTAHRVNFPEFITPWAVTPHNVFLTWWMNLGLLGLVGFIWIIWLHFRNIRLAAVPVRPFAIALGFAMLALLLHGFVDAAYWKNDLAVLFWLLIGFGQVSQASQEEDVTA